MGTNCFVVATGSPATGYRLFGPFGTETEAIVFAESGQPYLGWCTVMPVHHPDCDGGCNGGKCPRLRD